MPDDRKRAVYLRNDQWGLIDGVLGAALLDICKDNIRVSTLEPASRVALSWSRDRIGEIREAIKQ
jgi:hypothetical protein